MRFDYYHDNPPECPGCGRRLTGQEKTCPGCGIFVNGWEACGEDRCGNCHEVLEKDEKYCRYCGTRRGLGKFEPFLNLMECIYGPMPVERVHTCSKCGYAWTTELMVDKEKYCPKCGAEAPYEEKPAELDTTVVLNGFQFIPTDDPFDML